MSKDKKSFWDNPFGGLLDFNRDGREDPIELWIGHKVFKKVFGKKEEENYSTDFGVGNYSNDTYYDDTDDFSYSGTGCDWRDDCEDGAEYGIYPEDYDTLEEYEEALQEKRYEWRNYCDDGSEYGIYPEDYDTLEEYDEALQEKLYEWRNYCDDGSEYGIYPEDYDTLEEYEEALEEAMYGWRKYCEDYSEYGVYPEQYETEEEYMAAVEEIDEEDIYF